MTNMLLSEPRRETLPPVGIAEQLVIDRQLERKAEIVRQTFKPAALARSWPQFAHQLDSLINRAFQKLLQDRLQNVQLNQRIKKLEQFLSSLNSPYDGNPLKLENLLIGLLGHLQKLDADVVGVECYDPKKHMILEDSDRVAKFALLDWNTREQFLRYLDLERIKVFFRQDNFEESGSLGLRLFFTAKIDAKQERTRGQSPQIYLEELKRDQGRSLLENQCIADFIELITDAAQPYNHTTH